MYSYSIADREAAAAMVNQPYAINQDAKGLFYDTTQPLYSVSLMTWAVKCLRWWARFYQVLRVFARPAGGVVFALKSIWANLRRGMSLVSMLKAFYHKVTQPKPIARWVKARFNREDTAINGLPVAFINPHTNKHTRRMKCLHIANNMQTI